MPKSAAEIAAKQIRRAQEAAQDYTAGVQGVTEAPSAKAIRKKDKLRSNFNAAIDSGKWENNLAAVSLEEWKTTTAEKGSARFSAGVEAARPKIEAFHQDLQNHLQATKGEIDNMPDATPEQRDARMLANVRRMRKFRRSKRRR